MFPARISDGKSGTAAGGGWARRADPQQSGKVGPYFTFRTAPTVLAANH